MLAEATRQITGADIKNNSVTGKDIKESSLGTVPKATSASRLSPLPSGQSQSGAFGAAAGDSTSGYLGFAINYPRPLNTAIEEANIIDTVYAPNSNCPGAGQAAPGYLCLYFFHYQSVTSVYGWSTQGPYSELSKSVGVGLYAAINGSYPYVEGIWTVTAP